MTSMFRTKIGDRCHNSIVLNEEKQKLLGVQSLRGKNIQIQMSTARNLGSRYMRA